MARKSKDLTVVSFNMLGVPVVPTKMTGRYVQITREFERIQPDIIALQEVHTVRQLNNLVRLLPSYPYVIYKPYVSGPKGGLVVFSKIPADGYSYIKLTYKGAVVGKFMVSKVIRKGVLVCKFRNKSFYLLNTQLSANHDSNWSLDNRFMPVLRTQINEVKELVKEYRHVCDNLLLVGDFNIPKDTPIYKVFLKDTGMKDAFSRFQFPTLHMWFLEGWKKPERIDFVFYCGKNIHVRNPDHLFTEKYPITRRAEGYLSDHIALKFDLSFR